MRERDLRLYVAIAELVRLIAASIAGYLAGNVVQ